VHTFLLTFTCRVGILLCMNSKHGTTVDAETVRVLNAKMTELGSPYLFSCNDRGTLTYMKHYAGSTTTAYSVSRREVWNHLTFQHKINLDEMIATTIQAVPS
jgi:hypothetical protein